MGYYQRILVCKIPEGKGIILFPFVIGLNPTFRFCSPPVRGYKPGSIRGASSRAGRFHPAIRVLCCLEQERPDARTDPKMVC